MRIFSNKQSANPYTAAQIPNTEPYIAESPGGQAASATKAATVQIEVTVTALQQLLLDNKLSTQQIHCLNSGSKNRLKQLLLDNLVRG